MDNLKHALPALQSVVVGRASVVLEALRARLTCALLAAATLLTAGCGYVGGPLTPLANVPLRITDLAAVQRGDILIVHASVPIRTTENVLIKTPVKLDLRIGTPGEHFDAGEWSRRARPIADMQLKDGIATYQIPIKEWIGKEAAVGVRAIGSNGKGSDWSNFEIVPIVAAPEVPSKPDVKGTAAGERIAWTGRGDQFRVLRKTGDEEGYVVAATVAGHEFVDAGIEYGKPYVYMMQALVDVSDKRAAESDFSEKTKPIIPLDEFPPAVPSGLRADPTPNSVALLWEGDTEPDLAGYRVYRSVGDGPWQKLADVNTVPSYADTMIEHGKTYHYAVSAFDKTGNESGRSVPVEIVP